MTVQAAPSTTQGPSGGEPPAGAQYPATSAVSAIHVVAGLGASQGGPSYSVPSLCAALDRTGVPTRLMAVASSASDDGAASRANLFPQDLPHVPIVGALRMSSGLRRALDQQVQRGMVVHAHGLWLAPNVYAGRAARLRHAPLVVSPRGMLAPQALRFSTAKKRLFWALAQGPAYRDAACWHATSEEEVEDIRLFGIKAPVALIPNGIDLPPEDLISTRWQPGQAMPPTILTLGRIHPKKGLDRLIEAWSRLGPSCEGWRLRIVGPDEGGHAAELRALVDRLQAPNVSIEPPVYGDDKWSQLAAADIFVLATRSENFGLSVAEALASGVPVICTTGAPWAGLATEGCGWWIDQGVEPLASALKHAIMTPPAIRVSMGVKGREWMRRDFSWDQIAVSMGAVYRWLLAGGAPPDVVRLD